MVRCILAVIAGWIAGSAFNMGIVMLSWVAYPLPAGASLSDQAAFKEYVQSLPMPAFLLILLAHAGGALVGGFVAAWIASRSQVVLGGIIGGFFLLGGIYNLFSIPCPTWFAIVDIVLYVPCGVAGAWLVPRSACAISASAAD